MFKFSGFSPKANAVINNAMEEAARLGHCFIGTEHLLLGLFGEGVFYDFRSVVACKIGAEKIMEKLLENIGRGSRTNLSPSDFSPICRRVLENALSDAKKSGSVAETTGIIMAMLKESECRAVEYLRDFGCDLSALEKEVYSLQSGEEYIPRERQKQKTPSLDKYSKDLTKLAKEGALDPVIGRDKEIARVMQILSRRTKITPAWLEKPESARPPLPKALRRR